VFLRKLRRFTGLQLISLLAVAAQPLRFHADRSETGNGKTPGDILDAVKRFAALKSAPAEGLLFTVP
jgi:hypothetical protein